MAEVKELVGAIAFADGVQLSFKISRAEMNNNNDAQLGALLRDRIETARWMHTELRLETARG